MLAGLLNVVAAEPKLEGMLRYLGEDLDIRGDSSWIIAALARKTKVLVITPTGREAEELTAELSAMVDAVLFPAWETLPHERLSPGADIVGKRAQVLNDDHRVIITSARGVAQPVSPVEPPLVLEGEMDLPAELTRLGYKRVDLVAKRGEFATRGGIVDVFPTTAEHPIRVEFWGDEITDLREFSVADQRAFGPARDNKIYQARALLITPEVQKRAQELGEEKVAQGIFTEGMEVLIPEFETAKLTELDAFSDALVVAIDPGKIERRIEDLQSISPGYFSYEELKRPGWWTMSPFGDLDLTFEPAPRREEVIPKLGQHIKAGGRAAFLAPALGTVKRMKERLLEEGIAASIAEPDAEPQPGEVTLYQALSYHGALLKRQNLLIVTETDFTGNRVGDVAGAKRRKAKKRNRVDPLALKPGDFVVHETHGIGRFVKMTERAVGQSRREYILLEYAPSKRGQPGDQLYVPTDSLDMLSKYVGGEKPTLSKMGGSDWKNTKRKARAAVREIAAELVELYAKRQSAPGHAFAPDSPWQHELEDNFPYVETEDQMLAIEAVKADMERPVPMDRVVVGDVGYGKTEVAVRAAFKAVQDGKQVAVLVPTTLLAQQHQATFEERMAGFPVTIRGLSRFSKDSKETIKGLADGTVDIVIGTHRLLQTGVQWKNLGLVVVDEEQRFGVEHKEHIKALRTHVDVLTMSATPIPRTLEMSMAGIREMSTILTPPQDRYPILTYVGEYEDKLVVEAIRRELLREGQVFFVHNKVKDIDKRARELRELVPEARIVVAHGQMTEEVLERTVQGFWNREYDVLVCTTIVETGLDIANANTLIVENADHMGLSQLHQLRGRVGRSHLRGYAYFLYPKGKSITEASYDRLATIAQNNDLGAGMAVAMKDLEMRGAGNVLGAEQSGHIAGVGFDLYIRLVGEAVEAFRALADGKPIETTERKEVRIDLPIDAHIPENYVNSERLRLELYRKLSAATKEEDIQAVVEEMEDRYGKIPGEVHRLLAVARLRIAARAAGLENITVQGTRIKLHPVELPDSKQVRLKRIQPTASYRPAAHAISLSFPKDGRGVTAKELSGVPLLQWVADFLHEMFEVEKVTVSP